MEQVTINTKGTSTLLHRAEVASVSLTVSSTGSDRAEVSQTVVSTSTSLQKTLKEHALKSEDGTAAPGAQITHYHMTNLSTSSHTEWVAPPNDPQGTAEEKKQYTANTTFDIKFADFSLLSTMVEQLSATPLVSIHNISWSLTDGTRSTLESRTRKLAVENAAMKAGDFASAVGHKKFWPVEINADGLSGSLGNAHLEESNRQYSSLRASGPTELNLEPEEVEVSCTVSVVYKTGRYS